MRFLVKRKPPARVERGREGEVERGGTPRLKGFEGRVFFFIVLASKPLLGQGPSLVRITMEEPAALDDASSLFMSHIVIAMRRVSRELIVPQRVIANFAESFTRITFEKEAACGRHAPGGGGEKSLCLFH